MLKEKTEVIVLCFAAAAIYGCIQDWVAARLCTEEYITVFRPPLFLTMSPSPTLTGLYLGVVATLAVLLAQASQSPGLPGISIEELRGPILGLMGVTAVAATVVGFVGFELSRHAVISLPIAWADLIGPSQDDGFMAAWFAHCASYLFGVVGGAILIYRIWDRRHRPRLVRPFPRTSFEVALAILIVALLGFLAWLHWIRSAR